MFLALLPLALAQDVCPKGQQAAPNAADQCCWPAQVWDSRQETCLGTPRCPAGWGADGADCIAPPLAVEEVELRLVEPDENASVLGALSATGEVSDVFGSSSLSASSGSIGGLIGAKGTDVGALDGDSGGLSSRGSGLGEESPSGPYDSTAPIILGALDKSHIEGVIRRHMASLKQCYEAGLAEDPALAGQVVVKFVVAKDGSVSSAVTKSSTLGAPAVESCLNTAFMGFKFDSPKGGGIVIVSYPFVFEPG